VLDLCIFRDFKEYHTDSTVKFVVKMTAEKMAAAEEQGLHKVFKLQSNISTNTMVRYKSTEIAHSISLSTLYIVCF
jgi:DNA topoisomerase-2